MNEQIKREAKRCLQTFAYDEMNQEQLSLVVKYETEEFKRQVDKLKKKLPLEEVEDTIHDWWLDYQMADDTESELLAYVSNWK